MFIPSNRVQFSGLVVVAVVNQHGIAVFKRKSHPPIAIYPYEPMPGGERMNPPPVGVRRQNVGIADRYEKLLQPLMPERANHF
jgi:hypothetical protein